MNTPSPAELRKLATDHGAEGHPIIEQCLGALEAATARSLEFERMSQAAESRATRAEAATEQSHTPVIIYVLSGVLSLGLIVSVWFNFRQQGARSLAERDIVALKMELAQSSATIATFQSTVTDQRKALVEVTANIDKLSKRHEEQSQALLDANRALKVENERLKADNVLTKNSSVTPLK
jgi:hypothetical protein